MTKSKPRVPPVKRSEWTDQMRDFFAVMDGPEGWENGPSREVIKYLAQHPVLSRRFMAFGRHVLAESLLPHRERELVTLYIGWTTKSDYEWLSHVAFGLTVGLTEADIEAVKEGPDSPYWSDADRTLLRAVDQMRENYDLDDELWDSLARDYDLRQMMEWLYTIGNYMVFAAVFNALRIPLEPDMAGLALKYGVPGS